jgi:hypothetical protein
MRTIQRLIALEVLLNYRIYMALYVFQLMEVRRGKMLGWDHKVLTYIYRVQSNVWRLPNYPPPPSPRECVLPPGVHNRWVERGWGVNISEDARHWIGLLQYNPSTGGRVSSDEI